MSTDNKVLRVTRKYVLRSSTLYNIASTEHSDIVNLRHFDSENNMKLRSQSKNVKSKGENDICRVLRKAGSKTRKIKSLDSDSLFSRQIPKKNLRSSLKNQESQKLVDTSKQLSPKTSRLSGVKSKEDLINQSNTRSFETSYKPQHNPQVLIESFSTSNYVCESNDNKNVGTQIQQKRKSKDIHSISSPKKQRDSDEFRKLAEPLDSSLQLSQRSVKKQRTSDKFKEPNGFKYTKEIENITNVSRLNLKDRFHINSNTWCVNNFQYCLSIHSQNVQLCDYYTENSTKMLLTETRVLNFLKSLDGMIFRDVFPGVELIIELIGTILTYDSIDKTATNECIIAGSLNTFHRILFKFPPCIMNIKKHYRNLIAKSCYKSEIISLPNFEFQNGIFWKLIEMLETLIENDVEDDDVLNLSQQSEDGYDYSTWEKRQITKHYRHNIPRDDQIDRIFYTLQFLTDLMEYEFANWFQRQQYDSKNEETMIITGVIWPTDLPGTITMNVKRIITLFTKIIAVNFPENKIQILSSVVTLIGNVMLHEAAKNDYHIYPNRDFNLIEALSKEMFKIATNVQPSTEHSKIKLYSLIVTNLQLSALKMLFGNVVIDKIENLYTRQLNLEKLYGILISESWISDTTKPPKSPQKNKLRKVHSGSGDSQYQIYCKSSNQSGKPCEKIDPIEYIIVIFQTFKSYLNHFKLDTILRELNDPFDSKSSGPLSSTTKSPITQIKNNSINTAKIDYKMIEKNLNKSLKFFDKNEKLNKLGKVFENNNNVSASVKMDNNSLKQYHSDVEFFEQIVKCLQEKKNVTYFIELREFIKEYIFNGLQV